jgi:hypothetical protein
LDRRTSDLPGCFRPNLIVELWTVLLLDSTVIIHYGLKQAGREGVAFTAETADCLGRDLERGQRPHGGRGDRLDPSARRAAAERRRRADHAAARQGLLLEGDGRSARGLGFSYFLMVPDWRWIRAELGAERRSRKSPRPWRCSGTLYGARLLSVERGKRSVGALRIEGLEVGKPAHILTNAEGIHAVSAWRRYNAPRER